MISAADRNADVLTVAHQQQLRDLSHRERQTHDTITTIVSREWQRADDLARQRQPERGGVHLLFGQIEAGWIRRSHLCSKLLERPRRDMNFAVERSKPDRVWFSLSSPKTRPGLVSVANVSSVVTFV